jgi:hypothetical protein
MENFVWNEVGMGPPLKSVKVIVRQ